MAPAATDEQYRTGVIDVPAPEAKRKKSKSPTQRTLDECRKRGWTAQVVERWNPHAKVRVDLFGVIDLVVMGGGRILAIQACAGASHAVRRDKILAEPRARQWVELGGALELWSWSQRGAAGARKLWTLRIEAFTAESWASSAFLEQEHPTLAAIRGRAP